MVKVGAYFREDATHVHLAVAGKAIVLIISIYAIEVVSVISFMVTVPHQALICGQAT